MRVLILHGYSNSNAGDGLLVNETISLVREAFGDSVDFTLAASQPDTFSALGIRVINSRPRRTGWSREYIRALRDIETPDLVIGVGGGYLRAGYGMESVKAAIVHGPQLAAAARRKGPTVYMPQSIGPLRFGTLLWAQRKLSRIDAVYVRDDRSASELRAVRVRRHPDLALLVKEHRDLDLEPIEARVVLSVRAVRGKIPENVSRLAQRIGCFDGYVQSAISGNDDTAAMASLNPEHTLSRGDLLSTAGPRRVVIAVRLHAAIMAINAGHFVIHLAYERKGYGAFSDLGLSEFVHNVFDFNPDLVLEQLDALRTDGVLRKKYVEAMQLSRKRLANDRRTLVEALAAAVDQ
ncbi:polysaccharide pyruvyl transferase family protein [Rhodococcus koreensis]